MPTAKLTKNQLFAAISLALAVGTFLLYLPVRHNGFTNFDDDAYITQNPHVISGLNWANVRWGFTHVHAAYWIPLTWISHMIDCQLFGLNPGGHHLVSVLFHIANTLLLFFWLNQLTAATWRSAFVAALFAWHPLHVESVAWACERKDVLSTFFWMLALIAYSHYAKLWMSGRSSIAVTHYLLALFFFACGLMSKPMVVTLPCALLLVDFWPLGRFGAQAGFSVRNFSLLLLEKVPFFAVGAAGSAVGFLTVTVGGAVSGDTLSYRITNALASYVRYLSKIFWPTDLSIFYPFQSHDIMLGLAISSVILLMVCSIAFTLLSRQWPYLFVGWFWFLGTLVPVIGIIQAGSQSMADRFTYVPSIGMFVLVTWGLADFFTSPHGKNFLTALAVAALVACLALTSIQIKYWRSSLTVFQHALAVTTDNYVADACLGEALEAAGDDDNALKYCRRAVQINPHYSPGHFFLGIVLWRMGDAKGACDELNIASKAEGYNPIIQYNFGKFLLEQDSLDEAVSRFKAALDDEPDFAEAQNALGKTLLKQGRLEQAANQMARAVKLAPDNAQFHYDLGTVLFRNSKTDQAIAEFSETVRLKPDFALAHENLAVALAGQGKLNEAIEQFSKVVQLQPNDTDAHFNLGFALLQNHQPAAAAAQFSEEARLAPNETRAHYRLAQALEQQANFVEAVVHYREALRLTPDFPDAKKELDEILAVHPELR
jgi:tetratricopeptide (TPR) repeat protein